MPPSQPRRGDAARNRDRLLAAATRTFATAETTPSMRAIAREAGVGIATLLRHFPTQEDLIEAIYEDQAERLTAGAHHLLGQHAPADAMRQWMDLFGEWLATKRGMLGNLVAAGSHGHRRHPQSRVKMLAAITAILDAGHAAGDIRPDITAEDVSAHLVGIFTTAGGPAQRAQATRLLDQVMDSLRPPTAGHRGPASQDRSKTGAHLTSPDEGDDPAGEVP